MTKIAVSGPRSRIRIRIQDPDPHQNVMDPEHCLSLWLLIILCSGVWSFLYLKVDDYDSAVSAALTHLQFVPDSEDMINNLDYYR